LAPFIGFGVTPGDFAFGPEEGKGTHLLIDPEDGRRGAIRIGGGRKIVRTR
jgi:hypothetical protein